jgi:hypothetical protein
LQKHESCGRGHAIPAEPPEVDLVHTSVVPVAAKIYSKPQQQQQQQPPPVPPLHGPQQQPAPTAMPVSGGMTCNSNCGRAANLPHLTCCQFCRISKSHSNQCDQRQHLLPIAAIGASEELTPVQVQVDSTSQAMDETLVFSGTDDPDPELAAAGATSEKNVRR